MEKATVTENGTIKYQGMEYYSSVFEHAFCPGEIVWVNNLDGMLEIFNDKKEKLGLISGKKINGEILQIWRRHNNIQSRIEILSEQIHAGARALKAGNKMIFGRGTEVTIADDRMFVFVEFSTGEKRYIPAAELSTPTTSPAGDRDELIHAGSPGTVTVC